MLRFLTVAALTIPALALPSHALAGTPLTKDEVDRFVDVTYAIELIEEDYPDADFDLDLDIDDVADIADGLFDSDGDIRVTLWFLESANFDPEVEAAFEDALREAAFSSVEEFADVSDRVIAAAIAIEIDEDDLRELEKVAKFGRMDLSILPEEIRDLLDIAPRLIAAVEAVPASDIALVARSGVLD
ncbi:MAG: hypothetical protein AAGH41_07935 [Pseudomonadota bacterium]